MRKLREIYSRCGPIQQNHNPDFQPADADELVE